MINPFEVTNFNYTEAELQEFLIACIAVAGKTAKTIFPKAHQLVWEKVNTQQKHLLKPLLIWVEIWVVSCVELVWESMVFSKILFTKSAGKPPALQGGVIHNCVSLRACSTASASFLSLTYLITSETVVGINFLFLNLYHLDAISLLLPNLPFTS